MNFTPTKYKTLLKTLKKAGYAFYTFSGFIENPPETKTVILRHDIDKLPANAMEMAQLEHDMGIKATYYFRVVSFAWDEDVIRQIVSLGHEIGYHYEDLNITKGDYEKAIQHFEKQLARLRAFYPVKTICMHGSPMSKQDNRELWKKYDYRDHGIIAEPYFDVDYSEVFYITDTGRAWNKQSASIRDTVDSGFDIKIKSTSHLLHLIHSNQLPDKVFFNIHPQRWFNPGFAWAKELVWQGVKNGVKNVLTAKARRRKKL